MRQSIIIFSCCLLLLASSSQASVRVGSELFPEDAPIGGVSVPFRGGHLLEWWSMDVYTAAFYVPADAGSHGAMLSGDTPRQLVLRYHRKIKQSDIQKATERGITKNKSVNRRALAERLAALYSCYQDVSAGDEYRIAYDPRDQTTSIFFNGELRCELVGADFAAAFFAIWVSPYSLDEEMTRALSQLPEG